MDIKIITPDGKEQSPPKIDVQEPHQISSPVLPEMMERSVAEVMGIEDSAERNRASDKIQILIEYAKTQTKDHSPEGIKWAIRNLELKLGTPPLSEKRINYVAQYAYLLLEKRKIEKDIRSFEQI